MNQLWYLCMLNGEAGNPLRAGVVFLPLEALLFPFWSFLSVVANSTRKNQQRIEIEKYFCNLQSQIRNVHFRRIKWENKIALLKNQFRTFQTTFNARSSSMPITKLRQVNLQQDFRKSILQILKQSIRSLFVWIVFVRNNNQENCPNTQQLHMSHVCEDMKTQHNVNLVHISSIRVTTILLSKCIAPRPLMFFRQIGKILTMRL